MAIQAGRRKKTKVITKRKWQEEPIYLEEPDLIVAATQIIKLQLHKIVAQVQLRSSFKDLDNYLIKIKGRFSIKQIVYNKLNENKIKLKGTSSRILWKQKLIYHLL